ncbi:MAG TPA: asparaginase [Thermomicrobiales bacterium]|nr:asparaginase [Thermomicrobiales bacterium]
MNEQHHGVTAPPILAEFVRGTLTESRLRGHVAVVDADHGLVAAAGDPDLPVYFRSSAKPFQALPLIESGAADRFGFTTEELALACASHDASARHQRIVRSMLSKIGLTDQALRCGFSEPLDKEAAARLTLGLDKQSPVQCECSGKHAGMLAVCVQEGFPTDSYLDIDHPLQQRILRHVATATGVAADDIVIGVDGCGVPTFGAPLSAFARAYATLARNDIPALVRLRDAMTAHPELISGESEIDTEVMRASSGRVVAKLGAEGLLCLAVPAHGLGIAIKADAGVERAHGPAVVRVLEQLDVLDDATLTSLREIYLAPVTNFAGKNVGEVRAPLHLDLTIHREGAQASKPVDRS